MGEMSDQQHNTQFVAEVERRMETFTIFGTLGNAGFRAAMQPVRDGKPLWQINAEKRAEDEGSEYPSPFWNAGIVKMHLELNRTDREEKAKAQAEAEAMEAAKGSSKESQELLDLEDKIVEALEALEQTPPRVCWAKARSVFIVIRFQSVGKAHAKTREARESDLQREMSDLIRLYGSDFARMSSMKAAELESMIHEAELHAKAQEAWKLVRTTVFDIPENLEIVKALDVQPEVQSRRKGLAFEAQSGSSDFAQLVHTIKRERERVLRFNLPEVEPEPKPAPVARRKPSAKISALMAVFEQPE